LPRAPGSAPNLAAPRKDDRLVTFPDIETTAQSPVNLTRQKRQLADQAIAQASAADWAESAATNRKILELGPDAEAENRLAKSLWELGELKTAREHYQTALALDPTNRIAERNIDRLKVLMVAAGEQTVPAQEGSKAPVSIFVEETGKTGFAFLTDLADPRQLAQVNPGDAVELTPEGNRLIAHSNAVRIGVVEPRVAARLLKLIADGNKYAAGVTSLGDKDVRIILREIFQDPTNYGKVSFPTAAKSTDLRPYTKGTLVREEMDLEEDLEDDEEDEEIEDLDRVLPPESTSDEAFEDEPDELDEP
jgi:tetratricopeptide (TPR) repeat protein